MLDCLKYKQVTLARIKANSELINVILVIQTFERKTKKYKIKRANIFIYFEINLKKKHKKKQTFYLFNCEVQVKFRSVLNFNKCIADQLNITYKYISGIRNL